MNIDYKSDYFSISFFVTLTTVANQKLCIYIVLCFNPNYCHARRANFESTRKSDYFGTKTIRIIKFPSSFYSGDSFDTENLYTRACYSLNLNFC